MVAARLAEGGVDVVLVEAGPDYGPFTSGRWPAELLDAAALATTHDWGYHSGERWVFERARVLGGCSAHNGAIAAVGHRDDYDAWNGLNTVEELFNVTRHSGGTNYCFVDGHAAWRRYEAVRHMHFPDHRVVP